MSERHSNDLSDFGGFFGKLPDKKTCDSKPLISANPLGAAVGDVVVATRIRLSRNIADCPFPKACSDEQKRLTIQTIHREIENSSALAKLAVTVLPLEQLEQAERQCLIEFQAVIDAREQQPETAADSVNDQPRSRSPDAVGNWNAAQELIDPPIDPLSDDTVYDLPLENSFSSNGGFNSATDGNQCSPWNIDDLLPESSWKKRLSEGLASADVTDSTTAASATSLKISNHCESHLGQTVGAGETSVAVNEEDHLLLQVICQGLRIDQAWRRIDFVDDIFEQNLSYAFSPQWGYLTACPANVGTGMRASVTMHLPALATLGRLDQVFRWLIRSGIVGRGFYGDDAWGDFYRISNGPTLGKTELQLLERIKGVIPVIVDYERAARNVMLTCYRDSIQQQVENAFRAIKLPVQRSDEELLSLISSVRMGLAFKLLDQQQIKEIHASFEIKWLKQQLESAILLEQYSTATKCRDRIRQLEERRHGY